VRSGQPPTFDAIPASVGSTRFDGSPGESQRGPSRTQNERAICHSKWFRSLILIPAPPAVYRIASSTALRIDGTCRPRLPDPARARTSMYRSEFLWRRGRLPTRPLPRRFWRTLRTTTATSTPRRARPERSGGNSGNHHKPICQGGGARAIDRLLVAERVLFRVPGPQPTLSSRHYWSSARTRSPVRSSRLSPHGQAPPLVMWTLRNAMG
jgi:hypothetical protein